MSKYHHLLASIIIPAWLLCGESQCWAQVTGSTGQGSAVGALQVEEVIVTASKREETVQNVPSGITALTGATLDKLGIVNFQDYLPYVPGLSTNVGGNAGGAPGIYSVILRGLSTGSNQVTPTVGYYLDETPVTSSASFGFAGLYSPDPDLGDVERIEVLKGPQATLYGASTLGGIIKIVFKKPDLTSYGGNVTLGGTTLTGGSTGYTTRGSVNIPLIEGTLAAHLAAYNREDPGFTDNVLRGETNVNSDHAHGVRLDVRYMPTDRLDIDLMGLLQGIRSGGNTMEFVDPQTLRPIYGPNQYSAFFNTQTNNQLTIFSLKANYDTGFGTLVNSLSFNHFFAHYENFDFAEEFKPITSLFGPNIGVEGDHYVPSDRKTTEELRFTSIKMANFIWQLGLFYTNESIGLPANLDLKSYPSGDLLPPPVNPLLSAFTTGTYREYAAFGDVTYYFTDSFDATIGTRFSHNEQHSTSTLGGFLYAPLYGPGGRTTPNSSSASDESWLFDLRWRPSKQLSTYLRVASAYRPGGPQTVALAPGVPTAFGADTDWNYEVGLKSRWLDGRLNANADVYYIDWRNIQLNTSDQGILIVGNGGDAKSEGVEFDGNYELFHGFIIAANAAYNETAIKKANPANTAGAQVGDPLPYTPKWSGALTADYNFPLAANVTGGLGASWTYQGWRYSSFSGDLINTRERLPGYSQFSVRTHVDWSRYSAALHIDNVADKQTFSNVAFDRIAPGQPVPGFATVILPRTYRLTLTASF